MRLFFLNNSTIMHARTKKLRNLMKRHGWTCADVAHFTGRSVQTVRIWRVKETTRVIPKGTLDYLETAQAV